MVKSCGGVTRIAEPLPGKGEFVPDREGVVAGQAVGAESEEHAGGEVAGQRRPADAEAGVGAGAEDHGGAVAGDAGDVAFVDLNAVNQQVPRDRGRRRPAR